MPSIESQQAATIQALNEISFSEWMKKNPNPVPIAAAMAAQKGGQMAGKAAKKGAEVAAQAAEDIVPAVADWAGGVFDKIKGKFSGNPDDFDPSRAYEVDINSKESMDKWDWSTKRFQDFDGEWVFYEVAPVGQKERVLIKVKYDPMFDWDFEPMPWDEETELDVKLSQAWQKHLGSKATVRPVQFQSDDKGGNEMTTEQKVEEKQNPPANPTLYEGVTDPNFLPPKTEEVKSNPPALESLDAEWEKAATPEGKKEVRKKAFAEGMVLCRKGKKANDQDMIEKGKSLLAWSGKRGSRRKKAVANPPEEPKEPPKTEEPKPETNQEPVPVINPPGETKPEAPKCEHTYKYLGLGNPKNGGKPMKVFRCINCNKTFAKGADE
jgi:hypothetical protein